MKISEKLKANNNGESISNGESESAKQAKAAVKENKRNIIGGVSAA